MAKVNNKTNFLKEFTSDESMISHFKHNWDVLTSSEIRRAAEQDDPFQPDAEMPGLDRGCSIHSHQTIDMGEITEEDVDVIPRSFLTDGYDWESELGGSYGTDVIVISESELEDSSSHLSPSKVSSGIETSHSSAAKIQPRGPSPGAIESPSTDKLSPPRTIVEVQRVDTSLANQEMSSSFLIQLEKLQDRRPSQKKLQRLYHEKLLNLEARKKAPKKPGMAWKSHDPEPIEIMRRSTVEQVSRHISRRKSFRSKSASPEIDTESLRSGKLFVKRITRELGSTDLRKHLVITPEDMDAFRIVKENKSVDLVLQGKEVYEKLGRRIQDFDLPYIFAYIIVNREIASLDLSYNEITKTGAWYMMDFLSWNTTLKSLNLMNNDIDGLDSHMIDALCQNQTLQSLRLNGNPLGKQGGEYIAFLLMFKELELLDIGQTDQTIQSLAWISQALMQVEYLKVLDLSRILGFPGYVSDSLHVALAFSDILRFCSSLVELHLQKNDLTDLDLEQILFGFSFNKTLELLDLGCNQIGDLGAEMIANALQYGAPLKALMLSTNRIANAGARALSMKLPFSQIKLLDLADNRIGDQGIIDIVQTLTKPYPMLALFIFGNNMTTRSIEVIQGALSNGRLAPGTIDLILYYIDGVIGYGRDTAIDRYRARYYRIDSERRFKTIKRTEKTPTKCVTSDLKYQYHNAVNRRDNFREINPYTKLGPACPV